MIMCFWFVAEYRRLCFQWMMLLLMLLRVELLVVVITMVAIAAASSATTFAFWFAPFAPQITIITPVVVLMPLSLIVVMVESAVVTRLLGLSRFRLFAFNRNALVRLRFRFSCRNFYSDCF